MSQRPSVKLDYYSLYEGPSSSFIHVKIRIKTSCFIRRESSSFCCSVKHAIKNHVIVVMVTGYQHMTSKLYLVCVLIFVVFHRLRTVKEFVNTLCSSHLSPRTHALIPLSCL